MTTIQHNGNDQLLPKEIETLLKEENLTTNTVSSHLLSTENLCFEPDHIHLFYASAEGRWLWTGKMVKLFYYHKIAAAVFEKDKDAQDNYAQDPDKYAKSVENHIRTCISVAFIMNMQ